MAKKKTKSRDRGPSITIWCDEQDKVNFSAAAKADGFDDRTAWMLYHLRKLAKQLLQDAAKE